MMERERWVTFSLMERGWTFSHGRREVGHILLSELMEREAGNFLVDGERRVLLLWAERGGYILVGGER